MEIILFKMLETFYEILTFYPWHFHINLIIPYSHMVGRPSRRLNFASFHGKLGSVF